MASACATPNVYFMVIRRSAYPVLSRAESIIPVKSPGRPVDSKRHRTFTLSCTSSKGRLTFISSTLNRAAESYRPLRRKHLLSLRIACPTDRRTPIHFIASHLCSNTSGTGTPCNSRNALLMDVSANLRERYLFDPNIFAILADGQLLISTLLRISFVSNSMINFFEQWDVNKNLLLILFSSKCSIDFLFAIYDNVRLCSETSICSNISSFDRLLHEN